jgi:hypothetical protein
MLAFKFPQVNALLTSRGLAFEKLNRRGVRPIAICEAWLRLAAIVCIRLLPVTGPSLAPLQLGVGTPGGAENIGHTINAALRSDPDSTVVFSHDWANAFNTMQRANLFAIVASWHPALVLITKLLYEAHSAVRFFSDIDSGSVDKNSARGGRQENPLGPLLFALVLQRLLQAVAVSDPAVRPIAYADDTYLIGPGLAVKAAFQTLV